MNYICVVLTLDPDRIVDAWDTLYTNTEPIMQMSAVHERK